MHPRVHADGVTGARLDAESAGHAAKLVDHESLREALVAAPPIAYGILPGLDGDALGWTSGRAAEAGNAAERAIGTTRQAVQSPKTGRVWAPLFRVRDR